MATSHGPYPIPRTVPPGSVLAETVDLIFPTYATAAPSPHPLFCPRRVYQGSSGAVYPLPVIDGVADTAQPQAWRCIVVENAWLQLVVLPGLGGRIMRLYDKTAQYDVFYRQDVIKPALVGLAGPWISGGVEFNWPQHHRPSTCMPADAEITRAWSGAVTVWLSEHEPMDRLRGRVGLTLDPHHARLDARVTMVNRTPLSRSVLWWANAAVEVHDRYQSFFPPDVWYVADHAVRATTTFPVADGTYYGVDYRPGTDLTWYRNIPVPTSYMVRETAADFFGGYDHAAEAGFVHVADRRVAPGKKQWTWGNHTFGQTWDRELTDPDAQGRHRPYIELMAGLFTDNQPDFSLLMPYETREANQAWWPIQGSGPVQAASRDLALACAADGDQWSVSVLAPADWSGELRLIGADGVIATVAVQAGPGRPWRGRLPCAGGPCRFDLVDGHGVRLTYQPVTAPSSARQPPPPATEPPAPAEVRTNEELVLIAEHLDLYRHPTRDGATWLAEALRRDPGDVRANTALARRLLDTNQPAEAEPLLLAAIQRATDWHPNARDVEPWYLLGVARERLGRDAEADAAYGRALWSLPWRSAAAYRLAVIAARAGEVGAAVERCDEALAAHAGNAQARNLTITLLRRSGQTDAARRRLSDDPLDPWLERERCLLEGRPPRALDGQQALDLAHDLAAAGCLDEAASVLADSTGQEPLVAWTRAWLATRQGDAAVAALATQAAAMAGSGSAFPIRIEDEMALAWAGDHAWPSWALGCLRWHRRRPAEALADWRRSAAIRRDPRVLRCLGIAAFNADHDPNAAAELFSEAVAAAPDDGRLLMEYDQLRRRLGHPPQDRLASLQPRPAVVAGRDDLTCALAELLLLCGQSADARRVLCEHRFHPWEGGEGRVLKAWTDTHLALSRRALATGDAGGALALAEAAAADQPTLGESRHPLAALADIDLHRGLALVALGRTADAGAAWRSAAAADRDFTAMAVQDVTPMALWRALALDRLGQTSSARAVLDQLDRAGTALLTMPGSIDYFATSLPDLLVFDEGQAGLDRANRQRGLLFIALAAVGRHAADARDRLDAVLDEDPAQADAALIQHALSTQTWIAP